MSGQQSRRAHAVRAGTRLITAMLLCAFGGASAAHAATPTILLLHGGGWTGGDPAEMNSWRDDFEAHGYQTLGVNYPLGNVTRSIDYTDAIAQQVRREGGPVIAYGISAGGTIAAALAAQGRVDGAVDIAGPTNFTNWISPVGLVVMLRTKMSNAEKRSDSPLQRLNGRQTPQLLQCSPLDVITSYDQCLRYADAARRGNADTTMQPVVPPHSQMPADRDAARAWVQARWPVSPPQTRSARRRPQRRAVRNAVPTRK